MSIDNISIGISVYNIHIISLAFDIVKTHYIFMIPLLLPVTLRPGYVIIDNIQKGIFSLKDMQSFKRSNMEICIGPTIKRITADI